MWYIWLIAAAAFIAIEIVTVGFLVFWLAIGALFAMIVSFFTDSILIQTVVFVVSSILLIFLTKPFVNKLTQKDISVQTNAYSIIGKKGIVTQDINSTQGVGQIKVNGEIWSAKCEGVSVIEKGTEVEVTEIDGVKAVVKALAVENN